MGNDFPMPNRTFTRAETADLADKIKRQMALNTESDPLRNAIMNALCESRDARITAVRRKSSFHQLHAIVSCVADAVEETNAPLISALQSLVVMARTSGGTAGTDAELMRGCEAAEEVLVARRAGRGRPASGRVARPSDRSEGAQ